MIPKKMERPITIHEMENVAGGIGQDFGFSSDLGNTIEISDMNDALGFGMLANPGRQRNGQGQQSQQSQPMITKMEMPSNGGGNGSSGSSSGGLAEIELTSLDTVEPITLNLGSSSQVPIDIEFTKSSEEKSGGGLFANLQSATGPGVSLASAPANRMDPAAERLEKTEILNKLQRLEGKGFQVSKRYTMDNTLDEMRQEYSRLVDSRNLEASLRFQRQALMSVVTGLEWANGRFDPFDVKLDGWSEAVHENVEDFDEIFEELYDKYKERGKMPAEARLVMALAGSGFMCHVSNTFLKSRLSSVSTDDILKNNPDLARQFASAAAQQAGPGFGSFMNMAMGGASAAGPAQQAAPVGGGAGAFFGSSAQAASQAAAEAQARARAEMDFRSNQAQGGLAPQAVASMEPPKQTMRREMRGPSGVDDILRSFEDARRNESMEGTAFPQVPASPHQQPATAAAIEIQSVASGDDLGSMAESTKSGRRRRRAPVVGSTLSFNV